MFPQKRLKFWSFLVTEAGISSGLIFEFPELIENDFISKQLGPFFFAMAFHVYYGWEMCLKLLVVR